jgi:hypothetical protein
LPETNLPSILVERAVGVPSVCSGAASFVVAHDAPASVLGNDAIGRLLDARSVHIVTRLSDEALAGG